MPTDLPTTLPGLTDRETIKDALYRCVTGLDTGDATFFESAFTADASFDLNGKVMESLPTIKSDVFDIINKLDTTHFITNERIFHEPNANTAKMTASALAQHFGKGKGLKGDEKRLLTGSPYWIDLVREEGSGLWKIKTFVMKSTWVEGSYDVFNV